jgi:hypothetical protein
MRRPKRHVTVCHLTTACTQALQNKLWDVLVHQRGYPVVVSGDIQKAFLQVRVRENERDALRFYWRSEEDSQLETLRFTRVLFGLAPPLPPPISPCWSDRAASQLMGRKVS